MTYSLAEKRQIILNNYNHPTNQVELEELKRISDTWKIPLFTFRSVEQGCGDVFHIIIKQKNGCIEKCFFSAQQSCLITISVANIICDYLEGMENKVVQELINNCWLMLKNKKYSLDDCPKLKVFDDIPQFPNRLECVRLVIRGVDEALK